MSNILKKQMNEFKDFDDQELDELIVENLDKFIKCGWVIQDGNGAYLMTLAGNIEAAKILKEMFDELMNGGFDGKKYKPTIGYEDALLEFVEEVTKTTHPICILIRNFVKPETGVSN